MVLLVNLAELDPPINGGTWRIAKAVTELLRDDAVYVVKWKSVDLVRVWAGEAAFIIPYIGDVELLRQLQPEYIVSPLFGMTPFESFTDAKHIVSIPDTLALDFPAMFPGRERLYNPNAHHIVTLTQYAQERLLHHLNVSQVSYVYLGADSPHAPEPIEVPQPYVFYPANMWQHKRHDLLFRIMTHIWQQRPEMHLVLTGGRSLGFTDELETLMRRYNCPPDKVHHLGYVTDGQLQTLYRNAEAMLFTSAHEGFGMPLVEAMQNNCPVICAPVTAIPEVAGDAALYIDSDDPAVWAKMFLEALPAQRQSLITRGQAQAAKFTWEQNKAGWRQILDVAKTPPANPEQIQSLINYSKAHYLPTMNDLNSSPLKEQLARLEAIRRQETTHPLAKIPVVGVVVRLLIRFLNLGKMWNEQNKLFAALIERIDE